MKELIRVAIVGASGYSGEELVRILLRHPSVQLTKVTSRAQAGVPLSDYYGLPKSPSSGSTELAFSDVSLPDLIASADVFFLALPHGLAAEYAVPLIDAGKVVLDLSADFRVKDPAVYKEFYHHDHPALQLLPKAVYGQPELHREEIRKTQLIACPGCYPTSILLGLAPALKHGWIDARQIVINSLSGVSGAGRKADIPLLFAECDENLKAYSVPVHRHHSEIEQELSLLAGETIRVAFTPHLVPVMRGMHSTISVPLKEGFSDEKALVAAAAEFYKESPFVKVLPAGQLPESKRVMRTNRCDMGLRVDHRNGRLVIFTVIDNLGKGAAGQAVQAFNLRFGFAEETGLQA